MARYELAGGFFWVIERDDATISTTVGKLPNAGHTRLKTYGSAAEAQQQYDALVAEKLEQGYVLVGAPAKPKPKTKPKTKKKKS
jgi:predicted DNA-binding WGR domain protein